MTPEERYHRDPAFRTLVDMLHHCIQTADYTPTEVREAALLACIHHDAMTVRHLYCHPEMYEKNYRQLSDRERSAITYALEDVKERAAR